MKHNAIVPAVAIALLTTSASLAQPDDPPTIPAEPPPAQPADPAPADPPRSADILAEALRPTPGGLTMDAVAQRAVGTSRVVAQKRAEIEAAAADLDVALVAYFPTATLTASYTRLSPVDNTLSTGPGQPAITIPSLLNSYAFSAGLVVPISDYALRLSQQYASASGSEQALQIEARAEALNAAADAKIALLEWVRARGQQAVASMAVAEARAHVAQTEVLVDAGVASRADLLRLQAQLAEAEHLERAAGVLGSLTENQLRVMLHLEASTPMSSAVDVLAQPPAEMRSLQSLEREALAQRLELAALDQSERALDEADTAAHAGYYPRLDAFANALLANPNPRVFSQSNSFDMTWDVGVRLTWVINESFASGGRTRQSAAKMDNVRAQKEALADAIRLEVARAYYDGLRARSALQASDLREEALVVSLDAWLERYRAGKARTTDIIDGETELTRARLQRVDAHIDMLAAKVRLDHAVGAAENAP